MCGTYRQVYNLRMISVNATYEPCYEADNDIRHKISNKARLSSAT